MKKIVLPALALLAVPMMMTAQQLPTNTAPPPPGNGFNSAQFWSRGGNSPFLGTNNIFGTLWNSPIYTKTDNVFRMRLNGTLPVVSTTDGNVNTSGFLGLGDFNPRVLFSKPAPGHNFSLRVQTIPLSLPEDIAVGCVQVCS